MKVGDQPDHKVYREHTSGVPIEWKATQKGFLVSDQSTTDARYTYTNAGDEVGWVFWQKNTRSIGAWGQIIPVVATDDEGSIRPIADQNLGADTSFAVKTVVTSAATNDHTKAMSVTGSLPASGDYGFVVQTVDQDTYEILWFPASSSVIKCDNVTPTTYSTKIYGVQAGGAVDPSNVGTFDDFLFIESNEACIQATAKIRQSTTKKGPLSLEASSFPSLSPPDETPYTVETKCAFDSTTAKWRWYTRIGGGGLSKVYARIRWNYDLEGDLSEGEIMTYSGTEWQPSGTAIWISWDLSKTTRFETAGNDTVFEVEKEKENFNRRGIVRDLYSVVRCKSDAGCRISHFKTDSKSLDYSYLIGFLLSSENYNPPWEAAETAKIKTTILNQQYDNVMPARVPKEWNLAGDAFFEYLEIWEHQKGLPLYFRPIEPLKADNTSNLYESRRQIGGVSIANYCMV
ncbi:MAG: hypothetical protein DRI56_03205 [Chloroflexota bacterium]|nr:MAG: hypothetical protein DRI56_03205 [Chloroflexota bacterium]